MVMYLIGHIYCEYPAITCENTAEFKVYYLSCWISRFWKFQYFGIIEMFSFPKSRM